MFDLEAFKVQPKVISAKPLSADRAHAESQMAQLKWIKANRDAIIKPILQALRSIPWDLLPKGTTVYTHPDGKASFTYKVPNTTPSIVIGDFI